MILVGMLLVQDAQKETNKRNRMAINVETSKIRLLEDYQRDLVIIDECLIKENKKFEYYKDVVKRRVEQRNSVVDAIQKLQQ